jgi:hypothetical protein
MNATAAAASPTPISEKVTLTDGRVVEFAGKRKLLKETIVDGTSVSVRLDFRNGETRTFTVPADMVLRFAGHGAEQKLGDETAGVDDVDDQASGRSAVKARVLRVPASCCVLWSNSVVRMPLRSRPSSRGRARPRSSLCVTVPSSSRLLTASRPRRFPRRPRSTPTHCWLIWANTPLGDFLTAIPKSLVRLSLRPVAEKCPRKGAFFLYVQYAGMEQGAENGPTIACGARRWLERRDRKFPVPMCQLILRRPTGTGCARMNRQVLPRIINPWLICTCESVTILYVH